MRIVLLKEICLLRGANPIELENGDWMEVLANTFGVTELKSSDGSWGEAIIEKQREIITPPHDMSFWQELCYGENIADDIGSWILAYYLILNDGIEPYWVAGYVDLGYIEYS
jgi:hypothetical protein